MATISPTFGSSDLTNYFNSFTETYVNMFQQTRIPQRNGSIIQDPTVGTKKINLIGSIFGTDAEDLRTKINSLTGDLHLKGLDKLRIYDDKFLEAFVENISFNILGRTGMAEGRITARFRADNIPFWQSDYTDQQTFNTVESGDTVTLNNSGTINTPFRAYILNWSGSTASNISLTHTNSLNWLYSGTLANSEVLVVDSRSFTVTKESIPDLGNFSGNFFDVIPGSNIIEYVGPKVRITTDFNSRWINY